MAKEEVEKKQENGAETEIDILELLSNLWSQRKKLIKWSLWGAVIGLIVAFSIPKEYTTTVKLAPESDDKKGTGSLGSLASMAGINLGAGGGVDAVYPMLYPDVVSSVPFITGLFDVEVKTSDKEDPKEMTVQEYLEKETRSAWWSYIMKAPFKLIALISSDGEVGGEHKLNNFQLTKREDKLVQALQRCISTSVDNKTSVVTISVQMQDPLVSAMLADTVVARLQTYITAYRTNKARQDLEYAMKLNEEARQNYYDAQQRYADYLDRNQGLALHSAQTTRERLQNEASLAFNLYNQTAQQVQMAQAKVQETTPVYAVIEPASVPVKASAPRKSLILVGFTFLAFVACAVWVLFGKSALKTCREKVAENKDSSESEETRKKG
ncbi:MAG: chain-length determining protein [Muribaculaceae bacterium]|nr:chain-length determining protein [Muribaculaceae bacterium]